MLENFADDKALEVVFTTASAAHELKAAADSFLEEAAIASAISDSADGRAKEDAERMFRVGWCLRGCLGSATTISQVMQEIFPESWPEELSPENLTLPVPAAGEPVADFLTEVQETMAAISRACEDLSEELIGESELPSFRAEELTISDLDLRLLVA